MHTYPLPSSLNTHQTSSFLFQNLQSWKFFHWASVLWNLKTFITQNHTITLISDGMGFIFVFCFQAVALGTIAKLACFGKLDSFFFCPLPVTFSSKTLVFYLSSLIFSYMFIFLSRAEGCLLSNVLARTSLQCLDYLHVLTHELK